MEKILVGFDGSENARVALMFAIREAQVRDAALKLLCAWELPSEGWGEFPPPGSALVHYREGAEKTLADGAAIVEEQDSGLDVEQVVVEGRPGAAVLDNASDATMIVVGTRGHGGFTGLILGSVSQEVISKASIPVVVVPNAWESSG